MNELSRNISGDAIAEARVKGQPLGEGIMTPLRTTGRAVLRGPARPDLLRDEFLDEIFAASASAHPDKVCIVEGERELT